MKKIISIVLLVVMMASCVNTYALTVNEAQKQIWPSYHASFKYDKEGNFDDALKEYNNFIDLAYFLQDNAGEDHWENIKGIQSIVDHLSMMTELYVEANDPADAVYYGAKHEPRYGAFAGKCDNFEEGKENAYSLYVQFGSETVADFEYLLPENKDIYLEIAWNVLNENKSDLDLINSGAMDDYIISNLQFINTLKQKVFLRFGAEVNCWYLPSDTWALSEFIESYKSAFRRIADYARIYAPNAAIVYSPNDVSNWFATVEDFYPGDEYVDWVGMSSYLNLSYETKYERASKEDAYYCRGYYDNQIIKMKKVIDAFGDRKPIMISECGFAYSGDGLQNEDYAARKLEEFYSYLTMVYPQIKGVLYFNTNFGGMNYSLDFSQRMYDVYHNTIKNNVTIQSLLKGETKGYTRFTTLNENTDTLNLHYYAKFPSEYETSVSYQLDGAGVANKPTLPYSATIDVSSLSQGRHVLTVAVSNGPYFKTTDYVFYVGPNNFVGQTEEVLNMVYEDVITVTLNGMPIAFEQNPVIDNGRTLVPLRAIFEGLGATVQWDGATQTITSTKDDITIVMQIGSNEMKINDRTVTLDVPAKLVNSTTMVPVRAISEGYGCSVDWNADTKTVIITQ